MRKLFAVALVAAMTMAFVGCESNPASQKAADDASQNAKEAVNAAGEAASKAGEAIVDGTKAAVESGKETVNDTAKRVEEATDDTPDPAVTPAPVTPAPDKTE